MNKPDPLDRKGTDDVRKEHGATQMPAAVQPGYRPISTMPKPENPQESSYQAAAKAHEALDSERNDPGKSSGGNEPYKRSCITGREEDGGETYNMDMGHG